MGLSGVGLVAGDAKKKKDGKEAAMGKSGDRESSKCKDPAL